MYWLGREFDSYDKGLVDPRVPPVGRNGNGEDGNCGRRGSSTERETEPTERDADVSDDEGLQVDSLDCPMSGGRVAT